jgi:2-polyprenyl-6-methoxyphenol hydroxylase-like FAD-dependent oxidoreductase
MMHESLRPRTRQYAAAGIAFPLRARGGGLLTACGSYYESAKIPTATWSEAIPGLTSVAQAADATSPQQTRIASMQHADIVIAGGGLAGSTAAAMLARDGFRVILVDPHTVYPPDLRCEKLDGAQVDILRRTGLADAVLRAGTFDGGNWITRFGRLIEKRAGDQHGILYDTLVNTIRAEIPSSAPIVNDKVIAVTTSAEQQVVKLATGGEMSARLVVVANGLNIGLRHALGMTREDVSPCHSITIAFDLKPAGRTQFDFPALTYYPERAADRLAYITLFPIGSMMRANFMVYRDMDDPWLRDMRHQPERALFSAMPSLRRFTGDVEVVGPVKIRPADLYVTRGHVQPGVVLVGDAFGTSCPAAGTGTNKVFTDVERLCNVHVPRWFATAGMDADKIAAFYADPVKRACDQQSFAKAFHLRSLSIDQRLPWRLRRWSRFAGRLAIGTARRLATPARAHAPVREPAGAGAALSMSQR